MRAKLPVTDGYVDRDGVKIHYEVYGDGQRDMVFMPPWSIVHARVYKAQLPYFSERFRCIAYDGRGNGKSDRPAEVAAYALDNYVADALAVMDATGDGQGDPGGAFVRRDARLRPGRSSPRPRQRRHGPGRTPRGASGQLSLHGCRSTSLAERERFDGWDKYNRDYWPTNYADFAEHFVRNIFSEPHSTKQIEDGIWLGERHHRCRSGQDGRGARDRARALTSARRCTARSLPAAADPW